MKDARCTEENHRQETLTPLYGSKSIERLLLLPLYALDPASPPLSVQRTRPQTRVKTGPERRTIDFIRLACGGGDVLAHGSRRSPRGRLGADMCMARAAPCGKKMLVVFQRYRRGIGEYSTSTLISLTLRWRGKKSQPRRT